MITKKTKYALKALKVLATRHLKGPTFVSEIVTQENIPKSYLQTILVELTHSGLIESNMGKGGYSLAVPADQISFLTVLEVTGAPIAAIECASSAFSGQCADCTQGEQCTLKTALEKWQAVNLWVLSKTTIQDLL